LQLLVVVHCTDNNESVTDHSGEDPIAAASPLPPPMSLRHREKEREREREKEKEKEKEKLYSERGSKTIANLSRQTRVLEVGYGDGGTRNHGRTMPGRR